MKKNDAVIFRHDIKYEDGWEQKHYLLISDLHIDSEHCDRGLLKKLLDEAKAKNATILIFGDLFDMMGGKWDKRTSKGDIKSVYKVEEYFDAVIEEVAEFLKPYAQNIGMISKGNHEITVLKHHETNVINRLIYRLGEHIEAGDYSGFIKFFFSTNAGQRQSKTLYYTHGSGGNSPVTKGVIKTNRRSANIDADFFVSGHIHQGWNVSHSRKKLNDACRIVEYDQEHIQLGTFKDTSTWEETKEFSAPVKGGYWLTFTGSTRTLTHEIKRAK